MSDKADSFDFWGDYASDYAAQAVEQGFAEVTEVTEQTTQGFAFFGGSTGGATQKTRTAKVKVVKPGFKKPGPCGDTEAAVGAVGYCPADWV